MPIYEYRRPDGSTFEVQQSFSEKPLTRDPETGVKVKRVLHAPAVHFKGKGFYNTDYGTRKRQRETAAAESSSSDSSSSDSSTSTSDTSGANGKDSSSKDKTSSSEGKAGGGSAAKKAVKAEPAAAKG